MNRKGCDNSDNKICTAAPKVQSNGSSYQTLQENFLLDQDIMKYFIGKESKIPNVSKILTKYSGNKGGLKHNCNSVNKTSMSATQ